ncbi:MAG: DUF4340 domain-containing protein [Deltaproteobacteria bacterium]|nr:DUF4340 domain-containing protein [Deltaproteobacteria bacterium]
MRLRNTVFLAALLAAIVAYLYFVERKHIEQEAKKETLLTVNADAVTAVTLAYPDREIALEQRDGTWYVTKPVEALADGVAVKNMIRAIADAEVKKTIDDPPADLAPFGLAQPEVTVTLSEKGQPLPALKVGKTTGVSFSTYVQRADQPKIFLTGSGFHAGMDKQPKDLRDKTIVSLDDTAVSAVELRGPNGVVALAKQDGNWMITAPSQHRADNNAVRALLSTVRNLRATDFANDKPADADLAAYGLDHPARELVLHSGDQAVTLQLGKESEQGLYVRTADRPTVFVIGKWAKADLDKGVNELRDKTILTFDPTQVGSLVVTRGDGGAFTLTATDGKWALSGSDQPVNPAAASSFVGTLSRLVGTQVLAEAAGDLAAYGLAPPTLSVTVKTPDGAALGTVHLGSRSPNPPAVEYTAMRDGDPAVFQLRDNQFKQLDRSPGAFVQIPDEAPGGAMAPFVPADEAH